MKSGIITGKLLLFWCRWGQFTSNHKFNIFFPIWVKWNTTHDPFSHYDASWCQFLQLYVSPVLWCDCHSWEPPTTVCVPCSYLNQHTYLTKADFLKLRTLFFLLSIVKRIQWIVKDWTNIFIGKTPGRWYDNEQIIYYHKLYLKEVSCYKMAMAMAKVNISLVLQTGLDVSTGPPASGG